MKKKLTSMDEIFSEVDKRPEMVLYYEREAQAEAVIKSLVAEAVGVRKRRKLSQAQVAEHMGIDQSRVSVLEKGEPGIGIVSYVRYMMAIGAAPAIKLTEALPAGAPKQKRPRAVKREKVAA